MKSSLINLVLASVTLVGCVSSDETFDGPDPRGDDRPDGPGGGGGEPCTAATDQVPYDELFANLSALPIGDIARAQDGTLYFVSSVAGDLQSATVGRREPCGAIERDWLDITAPVVELEISSDNYLYMAASGGGSVADVTARLYALDLSDPDGFPTPLIREPGEVLHSLSAGTGGKLYFLQGWTEKQLRILDGDSLSDPISLTGGDLTEVVSVAAAPGNSVLVAGKRYGEPRVGKLTISNGVASGTLHAPEHAVQSIQSDSSGGYYGTYVTGFGGQKTFTLVHAPALAASQADVAVAASVDSAAFLFDVESPATALQIAPDAADPVTAVTLPVAVYR